MLPWTGFSDCETEASQTCGNVQAVARRVGTGGRKEIVFFLQLISFHAKPYRAVRFGKSLEGQLLPLPPVFDGYIS